VGYVPPDPPGHAGRNDLPAWVEVPLAALCLAGTLVVAILAGALALRVCEVMGR